MAIVVSDTSPIRALAHLNHLGLLHQLFGMVLVPPAVEQELRVPRGAFSSIDIRSLAFVRVQPPTDQQQVGVFRRKLDLGESEAIALALEIGTDRILIDEIDGRAVARSVGLIPLGVLGVLSLAKDRGLIEEIRPLIERLTRELRFFIAPSLLEDVLREAGE